MFGKCYSVPVKEVYTYDVSPSVVQRFRMLLEKLSNRGLTWEDDATQQVLSKELNKLRRIPYRPLQNRPVYGADSRSRSRPVAEAMDPEDQRVKPVEEELSRNLQAYLRRLGLLPKTSSSGLSSAGQSDRFQSGLPADFYRSQAAAAAQKSSPSFPSISSLQPQPKQRPPAARLLATQLEGDLLLATLRQYVSGQLSEDRETPPSSSRLRPFYSNRIENSGLKKESSKSRLLKAGGGQGASVKDPLSSVDERFIQNVLKNAGKQHVEMDDLTPQDLDQLSSLIADALQIVDQDQGQNVARVRPGPRDLQEEEEEEEEGEEEGGKEEVARDDGEEENKMDDSLTEKPQERTAMTEAELQERQTEERHVKDKAESLFTKLLTYLDKSSITASPPAGNQNSQTREVGVTVQKKDTTQSVEEVSEVQGWIKEVAPPPASVVYEKPPKKMLHLPELQLDVKAGRKKADDDDFGYVITDTDGLQTDEGLHLMEILARRANIQMTDFAELSVMGPAVTFKVSPNTRNVTTADVANVAGRFSSAVLYSDRNARHHAVAAAHQRLSNLRLLSKTLFFPLRVTLQGRPVA
ncbi:hypothetical protein LDENG_00169020 [Lucifuga dentata]|nr:hypothetical protein LDENG_00169020 [Lucifuga dentata]